MKKKRLSSKVHTCFGSIPTLTYPKRNREIRKKLWSECAKLQRELSQKYKM